MNHPRVVTLLPGATEMVTALGALDRLVGVSHECDWPAAVRALPRVTATPIDPARSSAEIHQAVQDATAAGRAVIGLDATALTTLRPDVLVTQDLCDVCAVADGEAFRLAQVLDPPPRVVTLSGRTLDGVWDDMATLGAAIGRPAEGVALRDRCRDAAAALARGHRRAVPRRTVAIEWLAPLFLAGHWVPEMIAAAGGVDVGAAPGSHSVIRTWDEVMALDPDLVLVILCGFDEARARRELDAITDARVRAWLAERPVAVLDGNALTSRPGPRLLDGIQRMAEAIAAVN